MIPTPLWVNNGDDALKSQCPLYPQKRTLLSATGMSALCQKQTLARFQLRVDWDDLGNILPGSVILRRPKRLLVGYRGSDSVADRVLG